MRITRIDVAVVLSLLAHGIFFAIPVRQRLGEPASAATFIAELVSAPAVKAEVVPEPVARVTPVVKPRPVVAPKTVAVAPPAVVPVETPAPMERAETPPRPQFDMLAMINARREQRRRVEDAMVQREEAMSAMAPGASDPLASINRNLQTLNSSSEDGTGGVFTILSKGTRTAEFAFNGWRPDTHRRWREVIEVDAGQGGDVERAIVRRMIELIRSHYTGDFIWRSHRLGKSLVMSARPENGEELEQFLVREFFDTPTLAHSTGVRPRGLTPGSDPGHQR